LFRSVNRKDIPDMKDFIVNCNNNTTVTFCDEKDFSGADVIKMSVRFEKKMMPEQFSVTWYEDNAEVYSDWTPVENYHRAIFPSWINVAKVESRSNWRMPVYQHLDKKGVNSCTVAVSDLVCPLTFYGGIDERTGKLRIKIDFFTRFTKEIDSFETLILCDTRRIPYYKVLKNVREFWSKNGYTPSFTPEEAHRRTYSSWYCFQKGVTQDEFLRQCLLAKEYGMTTAILDDGWQTPCYGGGDEPNAYETAGDWKTSDIKIQDMRKLADDLHANGIKLILWYATPFIGVNSEEYALFEGRTLKNQNGSGTVLISDPRYPDIREWYVKKLTTALREWNLDGFKLDFIDNFYSGETTPVYREGMDTSDISEAVVSLLDEIHSALTAIKPDIMLEYRQPYVSPAMQKTGNIMRIGDHAYGAMHNRTNGIDLRLMTNGVAVHSDMIMWDYGISAEAAADQLSNIIFITPQISMLFDKLPDEHKKMLKCYLDFIDDNRAVLLGGELVPLYPEALYPAIYSHRDGHVIAGLYEAESFTLPEGTEKFDLVNATGKEKVFLDNIPVGKAFTIRNCMGEITAEGITENEIGAFNVPVNGFFSF